MPEDQNDQSLNNALVYFLISKWKWKQEIMQVKAKLRKQHHEKKKDNRSDTKGCSPVIWCQDGALVLSNVI